MRINLAGCICAALTCALIATSDGAEVRMGKIAAYPHVGLSLAVPEKFTPRNTFEPYNVMRAVLRENEKIVQGITVSVFPMDKAKTLEQFARAMIADMKQNLAIRQLKILKETSDLRIADQPCMGCTMQYTFRGIRTTAARVYFVRDVPTTSGKMCYVLTVEADAKHESALLPVLDAVMKSFKLAAIRRPADVTVGELGPPVEAKKYGFSICPPRGWYVAPLPLKSGFQVAQTDYIAVGHSTATLQITVRPTPAEGTSKILAQRHLGKALKTFPAGKTLWQGPIKLAGLDAWQFVLHQEGKAKGKAPPSSAGVSASKPPAKQAAVTIVQTVLCVPSAGKLPARTYDLVFLCHGGTADNARATMVRIAATFKLLGRPASVKPKDTGATKPPDDKKPPG